MKSLDKNGRSLEEVVTELLSNDEELKNIKEPAMRAKIKIQRLKGEMRKYLNRPRMFDKQIAYIRSKIKELEEQFPEAKITFPNMAK